MHAEQRFAGIGSSRFFLEKNAYVEPAVCILYDRTPCHRIRSIRKSAVLRLNSGPLLEFESTG